MLLTSHYTGLLQATYVGSNTNTEIKAAQTQLRAQFKNQLFLETMKEILIQSPMIELKLSVLTILKEYSRYLINNAQQFPLSKVVDCIINIYKSQPLKPPMSFPIKALIMLSDNLKYIFNLDPISNIRLTVVKNTCTEFEAIQNNSYDCSEQTCFYLVLLTRSLICSPMFDSLNNNIFNLSSDVFAEIGTKLYKQCLDNKQSLSLELTVLLRIVSELFFYYLKRSDIKSNKVIQSIIWNSKVQILIINALKYTFRSLKGIYSKSNNDKSIESQLMTIQTNTFQLTEIIMRYRLNQAYKDKFQHQLLSLNPDIIQSIQLVLQVPIDQLSQNEKTLQTVTRIIRFYQTLLRYTSHAGYFQSNKQLYKTTIFPLLEIPLILKQSIIDQPDAFINFFNYVFDSSLIDDDKITDPLMSLKTSVAQFVIMSVEFVFILDDTITFCLEILKNSKQFRDRSVCMIILGILSYNARTRNNILDGIRQFLESQIQGYFDKTSSDMDIQALEILEMMLISKFLIPINNPIFSSKVFKLITKILANSRSQPHRILCLDILTELIKLQGQYKSSTEELISYLVSMTNNPHEAVRVLDILAQVYSSNSNLKYNFELSFKMCQFFVSKIKNSYEGKEKLSSIVHSKCWNMISNLFQIEIDPNNKSQQFIRLVQKQVSTLYSILQLQDFQNQKQKIIHFNLFLLTKTRQASIYQQQIVLNLPIVISKSRFGIELVYQFLMVFIKYGYSWIQTSEKVQNVLFTECIKPAEILRQRVSRQQVRAIKGVLLLEILLLYSNRINPPQIDTVLEKIIDLVQNCHIFYTFTKSNLVSFLLFSLINISSLTNQHIITKILKIIFQESDCIKTDFSSKIYVLGLCTLLQDQALNPNIRFQQKHLIVKCIAEVLTFSLTNVNPEFDDEETQYFDNVKLIFKNIPKIDEVEYFKGIMTEMKTQNGIGWKNIVNRLNNATKESLSSLLRMQFVHAGPRQILKVNRAKFTE